MQHELLALQSDWRNASAWNNLVLKKLMVIQLTTAIRKFYGTRRSNVIFKKARQVFSAINLLVITSSVLLWCSTDVPKHWNFAVFMKDESYTWNIYEITTADLKISHLIAQNFKTWNFVP